MDGLSALNHWYCTYTISPLCIHNNLQDQQTYTRILQSMANALQMNDTKVELKIEPIKRS
jgi:uncharacterized protein YjaG (DUF416 family)